MSNQNPENISAVTTKTLKTFRLPQPKPPTQNFSKDWPRAKAGKGFVAFDTYTQNYFGCDAKILDGFSPAPRRKKTTKRGT
jgi:hypothetical protein